MSIWFSEDVTKFKQRGCKATARTVMTTTSSNVVMLTFLFFLYIKYARNISEKSREEKRTYFLLIY